MDRLEPSTLNASDKKSFVHFLLFPISFLTIQSQWTESF
jgi:hypothetical protein